MDPTAIAITLLTHPFQVLLAALALVYAPLAFSNGLIRAEERRPADEPTKTDRQAA
jgi:hypothetical protein